MAQTTIENGTITVEDTAQSDHEARPVFEWTVRLDSGEEWTDLDLRGPRFGPEPSEEDMLRTFFSFLSAAVEARQYRESEGGVACENEDLFPSELLDWAVQHSDDISIESIDPEEDDEESI